MITSCNGYVIVIPFTVISFKFGSLYLGGISGPFSKVHASFRFKHVTEKFKAVALIQDPSGLPVDQLEMEIPEGKILYDS